MKALFSSITCLTVVLMTVTAGRAAPAAKAAPATSEEVVALPPLVVEWRHAPLRWRYLELPGFELLTVCSDETAVSFAARNRRLAELLRVLVADRFLLHSVVPETHVLFHEETGRARSQEVIEAMVQAQGLKLQPDGTLQMRPQIEASTMGLRVGTLPPISVRPRQVIFLPNMRLGDRDSLAVFSILPRSASGLTFGYAVDRLEFLLEERAPALPPWFITGLLGVFRQARLGENEVTLDRLRWLDESESRALAADSDQPRRLLTIPELLAGRRAVSDAAVPETAAIWEAQCTLWMRWVLADPQGRRRAALEKFVDRLEREAPTEMLFRECFGLGFADMRDRLSDYLPVATARRLELPAPAAAPLPRLNPRPATPLEVARIRGNWERREIGYVRARYPSLAESYLLKARATLRRAYDTGERDPRLLAELGLTELEGGDPAEARRFLEEAVAGGVVRPRAAYELARLRYAALPAGDAALSAAQVATVLEPLHVAQALAPPLREAYALLAAVWGRSPTPPPAADLARLNAGVGLFPQASAYVLRVILFNVAQGDLAAAQHAAHLGELHAVDAAQRERFAQVRAELELAAAGAASSGGRGP